MIWKYVELETDDVKSLTPEQAVAMLIARWDGEDLDADAKMQEAIAGQFAITIPGDLDGGEALLVPPDIGG